MDNPEGVYPAIDQEGLEKETPDPGGAPGPAEADTPVEPGVPGREDYPEGSVAPAGDEIPGEAFWERLDRYHDEAYVFSHRLVEGLNGWFVPQGKEPREVPASHWRITLQGVVTQDPDGTYSTEVPLEAHASFTLPDTDRLNIFITTTDPGELPSRALPERDTSLRVGVAKSLLEEYISTSLGVKARNPPVVFADIAAGTVFGSGVWKYYPRQKIYWENEKGEGAVASFVADRWVNPWDVRVTTALKWSRHKVDSDDRVENDERGWQWDCGLIFGYAQELLKEPDVVRFMGGRDLARGVAVRLGLLGAPWSRHAVSVLLMHKGQIRARWLHYFIEPQVQWSWEGDWERTIILTCGIEAIFWGGENR